MGQFQEFFDALNAEVGGVTSGRLWECVCGTHGEAPDPALALHRHRRANHGAGTTEKKRHPCIHNAVDLDCIGCWETAYLRAEADLIRLCDAWNGTSSTTVADLADFEELLKKLESKWRHR